MPEYRRWRQPGGCYFFTVNLFNRRSRLLVEYIDDLRDAFATVREKRPFHVDAVVILPDHLHAMWTLPSGDDNFTTRWRQIKERFSRAMAKSEYRSASRLKRKERGIWQRRFYEHLIRDEKDYERHVDYIHFNPVKHGHADRPIDWPYSSLHRYVKQGILDADWGTSGGIEDMDLD